MENKCFILFKPTVWYFLALPKPVGLFPLDKTFGGKDVVNQENVVLKNVQLTIGPDGMDKFILCLVKRMIYSCYNLRSTHSGYCPW